MAASLGGTSRKRNPRYNYLAAFPQLEAQGISSPSTFDGMLFAIGSWHRSRLIVTRELREHRPNGKGRSSLQIHFIF